MIQQAIQKILGGTPLTRDEVEGTAREIAEGKATQAQMGGFLVALARKGETPEEIASFASTLRGYSVRIDPQVNGRLVDTCGTGGDRAKTFNVSTVAALVAAGAGASVAKHGNRSVTSKCGSADVLERLGYNVGASPAMVKESIEKFGVGFMFAPAFHPAMKYVAPIRRELGVRTVFNLMGPLINPAGASAQLVGVYSPELVEKVAVVLMMLGCEEALVVHAREGMDEISTSGKTLAAWLREGEIETLELSPADFGIGEGGTQLREVGGAEEAAQVVLSILGGGGRATSLTDTVLLNSAAALVVAGRADDFPEGVELARESLASGEALARLRRLVEGSGGDVSRIEAYATIR
ncbi:MAG: anthranilate phosphoribosyltransferase [Nitrososphaerota archaeon]|nr:anthranilate phosphoribosyltransferase [Nitrososphaerota archaeon]MDG6903214.1 anthranilate phosphoribosyltransferase [Nitrososphaerota archaeon]MDG6911692.1 anthranilate phosphoribosyltransferase [Nitrososphaerota archaeon]MDG6940594.1 anthranilate phosphoribosyltransferase [Nitrososphaerota archaeon]MDG6960905.1 anthranilate phosphoribosyltransferase [Nitrososphaerota archaeon]